MAAEGHRDALKQGDMQRAEELLLQANRVVFARFFGGDAPVPPQVCYDRAQTDARRGFCLAVTAVLLIAGGNERLAGFGGSGSTAQACRNASHAVDGEAGGAAAQLEALNQALEVARMEADQARELAEDLEGRHLAELYTAKSEARQDAAEAFEASLAEARAEAAAAAARATALLASAETAAAREAELVEQAEAARHALSLERASSAAASVAAFGEKAEAAQAREARTLEHRPSLPPPRTLAVPGQSRPLLHSLAHGAGGLGAASRARASERGHRRCA